MIRIRFAVLCSLITVPMLAQAVANTRYVWADVIHTRPIYGLTQTTVPSQRCYTETVTRRTPAHGSAAGTMLGAVVGGVLGNAVGRGSGRTATTVAGAIAGGAVGNHVSREEGRTRRERVTRCEQVNTVREKRSIVGYRVKYRYRGDVYKSRLSYDPGTRLRIRISVTPVE